MQRTQIYLPKKQLKTLQQVAQKTENTVSGVIRLFLAEKLNPDSSKTKKTSTSLTFMAKRVAKMGKPGPKDLASELDKYLYE